ncbi:MAG: preprotein translocase subunit YajC [Clostridia bacterium]|nr:preprotein translocase subunit YajC [Clostridia bacterium]
MGNNVVMIVVLVVLMIGMFAMSIIPQRKRQKKAQEMMNSITVGTKIKTIGGFVGEVKKIDNANNLFTLDISANNDGSTMVVIDRSAVYTVLEAVKTSEGEVKIQEKPQVAAMDDMEADSASKEKKAKKSESKDLGDSLEKTDNETLLKD